MSSDTEVIPKDPFAEIRKRYFSDPARTMHVAKGEYLLRQDHPNDKLFYVVSGSFTSNIMVETMTGNKERLELFGTRAGGFVGVRSFFAGRGSAFFDIIADVDSEVIWMDQSTQAVEPEKYGGIKEQFFPVILRELENRQFRLTSAAKERVSERIRLHVAEDMATLGQFAAGLAHELNNATSVIMSSSDHLVSQVGDLFQDYAPDLVPWFERGMKSASALSTAEVRTKAREFMQLNHVSYETAKDIVRMTGGEVVKKKLPRDLEKIRTAWAAGRNCRDIRFAGRHAANIIHSIKQLNSGGHSSRAPVDVVESINSALDLLGNTLRGVDVRMDTEENLPQLVGNSSELMQIWVNIAKNAYEAMNDAGTQDPRILITVGVKGTDFFVKIANNGPKIPPTLQEELFKPSITTKSGSGSSMGLGLGLYIAKKVVDSYNGRIELINSSTEVSFIVYLPLTSSK